MTNIIDPSKIETLDVDINSIEITPWNTTLRFLKCKTEDEIEREVIISFTDEQGNLTEEDIGILYHILFTNPEYQNIVGVFYKNDLVALNVNIIYARWRYITWDDLGVMVVNCLEGMKYQKESMKNENFNSGKES